MTRRSAKNCEAMKEGGNLPVLGQMEEFTESCVALPTDVVGSAVSIKELADGLATL
jgi:hypothetical protein